MTSAYSAEPELVGSSSVMAMVRRYVQKVAQTDTNVLITGPTGTGKELVASAIHRASRRRAAPFVSVNCAAIPDALLESELFGYERGAFSGAEERYPGKLRLADQGTVFLDEVGDLSALAQAKILRVLESREVFPLGGRKMTNIDVRFVAATNQDLESLIQGRCFREDLFFRLNVARIFLPPLRQRPEDIPELFQYYVQRFNLMYARRAEAATAELNERLVAYDWPGNVRELRNCVEAIFIDPPDGPVALEHLPENFRRIFQQHKADNLSERDAMLAALARTNWNKKLAARELHWSRMTLYRKLEKYKLFKSN